MNNSVVSVKQIGKTFYGKKSKEKKVIQNVSLEVGKREIIGIMGPSGCGKTTLAKIIAGIETPTDGELEIFGQDCRKRFPKDIKKKIGFVYQDNNLLPWRTVENNLRFPLEVFGMKNEEENKKRIEDVYKRQVSMHLNKNQAFPCSLNSHK